MDSEKYKDKVAAQPWWVVLVEGLTAIILAFKMNDSSPPQLKV